MKDLIIRKIAKKDLPSVTKIRVEGWKNAYKGIVRPDLKRSGIGKSLFNYVCLRFKKENKHKMVLWCLKENESSKKFYLRMGGKA